MNRPSISLRFVLAALLSFPLAACGGPQWVVHSQAAPDPFLNQKSFSIAPVDFTGYLVGGKSEADYLSSKSPDTQQSFQADKASINDIFLNAFAMQAGATGIQVTPASTTAPFQIHPTLTWLEPGYYIGISAAPAELKMVLRVTTPDGKLLDEIELDKKGKGLATGARLRMAAENLGHAAGTYLSMRVTGKAG